MGNRFQRLIYNLSVAVPLFITFALAWLLQRKTLLIPFIALFISIVIIIIFFKSFTYGKRNLASTILRTKNISPCDGWIVIYLLTYIVPFASLAIEDIDLVISIVISSVLLIAISFINTAIPNPLLFFFRGLSFL